MSFQGKLILTYELIIKISIFPPLDHHFMIYYIRQNLKIWTFLMISSRSFGSFINQFSFNYFDLLIYEITKRLSNISHPLSYDR